MTEIAADAQSVPNSAPTSTNRKDSPQLVKASSQTVEQVDPRTLLLDKNIRLSSDADKDFVASIKDVGVLQSITAVRTGDGQVRVRYGHRRTMAAIAAGLATVPVEIIGDEGTDSADEIERLVRQRAENKHRAALTLSEDAAVVEQLSLLGVSEAQIAKRLRLSRPQIKAARSVAGSKLASAAGDKYELDLEQAAAVAEFESNTERVKALVAAAKTGQFQHVLAQIRQEDTNAAARQELLDSLAADGVRVVKEPRYDDSIKRLSRLYTADRNRIDPAEHSGCPGHAVYVEEDYVWVSPDGTQAKYREEFPEELDDQLREVLTYQPVAVCERADELHPNPYTGGSGAAAKEPTASDPAGEVAAKEAAKASRRRVIEGNKEWDAAEAVRRGWVRDFLQRKTPPVGAVAFITTELLNGPHYLRQALERRHPLAADLFNLTATNDQPAANTFGNRETLAPLSEAATDKRLTVVALGLLMAAGEDSLTRQSWRGAFGDSARNYLRFIIDQGYQATNVERIAAGLTENPLGEH